MKKLKKIVTCYDCRIHEATVTITAMNTPKKSQRKVCKICETKRKLEGGWM